MSEASKKELYNNISIQNDDLDLINDNYETKDLLQDVVNIGQSFNAGVKMDTLQKFMSTYQDLLNTAAISINTGNVVNTPVEQFKGFIFEELQKFSLKCNALAKGIPDYKLYVYTHGTMPNGEVLSRIDMKSDVSIWTKSNIYGKYERYKDYQLKLHNDSKSYLIDRKNPQYEGTEIIGGSGQGVPDKMEVKIGKDKIQSDNYSVESVKEKTIEAKNQNTKEYEKKQEKTDELNKINAIDAIKIGAISGAVFSAAGEIFNIIKKAKDNEKIGKDEFIELISKTLCGGIEGGTRGGVIYEALTLYSKIRKKEIAANSFEAVPALAIGNLSIDVAKDIYRCFIEKSIDEDDLLCNTIQNSFVSFTGYAGGIASGKLVGLLLSIKTSAEAGAVVGAPLGPIGMVIGSVIGGLVVGTCSKIIISGAEKEAIKNSSDTIELYNDCVDMLNKSFGNIESERLLKFADSIESLNEFRVSFDNLVPGFNILSDFKEYNIKMKAMKKLKNKMESKLNQIDDYETKGSTEIIRYYEGRLAELRENINQYVISSQDNIFGNMTEFAKNEYSEFISHKYLTNEMFNGINETIEEDIKSRNVEFISEINEFIMLVKGDEFFENRKLESLTNKFIELLSENEIIVNKDYMTVEEGMSLALC